VTTLERLPCRMDGAAADGHLERLADLLSQEWIQAQEEERALIARESAIQTELARRQWTRLFCPADHREEGRIAPETRPTVSAPPAVSIAVTNVPRQRVPRPGLARQIAEAWSTSEGKRLLTSLPMRELKLQFGVTSHSSFYDVPLFNDTIRPLRGRGHRGQQAANWLERNARQR
jgi:hypothetical protein